MQTRSAVTKIPKYFQIKRFQILSHIAFNYDDYLMGFSLRQANSNLSIRFQGVSNCVRSLINYKYLIFLKNYRKASSTPHLWIFALLPNRNVLTCAVAHRTCRCSLQFVNKKLLKILISASLDFNWPWVCTANWVHSDTSFQCFLFSNICRVFSVQPNRIFSTWCLNQDNIL